MKSWFRGGRQVIPIIICLAWIFLLCLSLALDFKLMTWSLVAIAPVTIMIFYLFRDPEIFLFLTVFFIPLSVKLELPGGLAVSFPSEFMAVLLVVYLIFNISTVRIPDTRIFSHPIFLILLVHLGWMIIAAGFSELPLVSMKHTFIQALYIIIFYFLLLTKFDEKKNIVRFFFYYSLGMLVPIANGMIWHSQYHFNSQASYYMPQPFFIEHTIYGATIAFLIPMLLYLVINPENVSVLDKRKLGLIFLLLILLVAEFFASSRAAWLSLLVLPFFLTVIKLRLRQEVLLIGFVAMILVVLVNTDPILGFMTQNEARSNRGNVKEQIQSISNIRTDISNLERINRWECALRMYEERPFTGYGPGTYQFVYGTYQIRKDMTRISTFHGEKGNAHSEYLGFLAETGVPGLVIYLSLIMAVISTALRIIYKSLDKNSKNLALVVLLSLLTFYFHTIFNGFIETDKIGSLYYGSLASITALDVYFFRKEV